MTGQRFGHLVVIERVPHKGPSKWRCKCDCGKESVVGGGHLRVGNTKSCGHLRAEYPGIVLDIGGRKFGLLTALNVVPSGGGNSKWLCQCECGQTKVVRSDHLMRGMTISCGCAVRGPFVATRPIKVRQYSAAHQDKRGKPEYTAAEIEALAVRQNFKCMNCLVPISADTWHKDHVIPLSRGGGRAISNIQLLCAPCNRRKYNKLPHEFALEEGRLV